jgi:ABC-type transport system involved in multi-copper enzyme maturation permease subunit
VAKDWQFQRLPIAVATAFGGLGLALMLANSSGAFYIGVVMLITAIISLGIYLAFLTVVNERTEGMLPFVMSLPIGVREYTAAKLAANLLLFLAVWGVLSAGAVGVVLARAPVPDGLVPYAVVLLLHLLTGYVLSLGVAILTMSPGWTITVAGGTNLLFQGFMYWTSHLADVAPTLEGEAITWPASLRWVMAAELLAVVAILGFTWARQRRRTDFP